MGTGHGYAAVGLTCAYGGMRLRRGGGTKESLSSLSISRICTVKASTRILRTSTAVSLGLVYD